MIWNAWDHLTKSTSRECPELTGFLIREAPRYNTSTPEQKTAVCSRQTGGQKKWDSIGNAKKCTQYGLLSEQRSCTKDHKGQHPNSSWYPANRESHKEASSMRRAQHGTLLAHFVSAPALHQKFISIAFTILFMECF